MSMKIIGGFREILILFPCCAEPGQVDRKLSRISALNPCVPCDKIAPTLPFNPKGDKLYATGTNEAAVRFVGSAGLR